MNLEPIDPETALELYLAEKETEAAKATIDSHRSRLGFFLRWCDERGIENLNELTGRRLHEFRLWRRNVGELSKAGEKTQMDTVRVFVRWLESIDAVEQDLHLKVRSPNVTADENTREVMLDADDAKPMLEYYSRYEYASLPHVTVSLLWHTMMRLGAARALDVEDYDPEDQCLELRHRPETGTPIKNKKHGERLVALSGELCLLLDDWLRDRRPDVTDSYDREPLLATAQGRVAKTTIRKYCYQCTRPCVYGDGCPHDRNPDDCDANEPDNASQCPSSVSPHAFRRGSITHYLNSDVPETAVSDRANVSKEVLDQHYDQRSKRDKMQQRRKYLNNI
ncbi:site-specific integrase [Halalkalicoccus sp. NIPERK01]|uniref:tyrosine-type recombinase/integrase n=1 Tax=Halalkalicoccus sp. NIPERK01 TaxID=3053469 RepID=UPI00256F2968|nr:site-specific integrase [Halalkalicoccus sp. NIPERK01]MDL5362068.1 tyrosine-type recombinase/integrase [Halalkalicoccus sp. NIPERK01]